jgi:membrane protease YdiL (CAAX protease family)
MNKRLLEDAKLSSYIPNFLVASLISICMVFLGSAFTAASLFVDMEPYLKLAIFDLMIGFGMTTVICMMYVKFTEKRSIVGLGFYKSKFKHYFSGLGIGIVMFALIVLASNLLGGMETSWNSSGFKLNVIVIIFLGFVIQGGTEEVIYRGWLLPILGAKYNLKLSIIISSVMFALLHSMNPGMTIMPVINLTLFGVFAALFALAEDSIWGICGFHSAWNWVQGSVFGVKVSGTTVPGGSVLSSTPIEGQDLISGGAFGIEGSVLCSIAFLIGIVYLVIKLRREEVL